MVAAKLAALPAGTTCYLVEDSGLFLEGLGGFPGVYSAYAYRTLGLSGVLRALQGRSRAATFRTVAGIRWGDRKWIARGTVRGRIAARPRGTAGFGYDPIFIPSAAAETFAQLAPAEKDQFSHRGRAIRAVARKFVASARPRTPATEAKEY